MPVIFIPLFRCVRCDLHVKCALIKKIIYYNVMSEKLESIEKGVPYTNHLSYGCNSASGEEVGSVEEIGHSS